MDFELNGKKITAARIIGAAGHRVSSYVYLECYVENGELDTKELGMVQAELGYHPDGYGGPVRISKDRLELGVIRYCWSCYASAD